MVERLAVQGSCLMQSVIIESLTTIVMHHFTTRFHKMVEMLVSKRCQSQIDVADRTHVRIVKMSADTPSSMPS
jgi:hypothetical protein